MIRAWMRVLAVGLMMSWAAMAAAESFDVLIRNGRIVDGTGNPWFYGDVGIRDGRIAAVGDLAGVEAARVIDAQRHIVAPGFIDVHTHADDGLYDEPHAENFIRNGVTSIVTGNCGGSVRDVARYFARLEKDGVALNVATLYGHNTILRALKGDVRGDLTPEQLERGRQLMAQAMRDGAVGMSTGLIYTPGRWSPTEEIIELQKAAAQFGGVYVSHMRDEGTGTMRAVEEALRIGREAGSSVQISHLKMPRTALGAVGGAEVVIERIREARRQGQEVWADQYPYTASSTGLNTLIPSWAREQGNERMREILTDPEQLPRVLEDMRQSQEVRIGRTSMDFAVIASSSAFPYLAGMNLHRAAQVRKLQKMHGADFDWMSVPVSELPEVTMEDQYRTAIEIVAGGSAGAIYHTMPEEEVEKFMRAEFVAVASDSGVRSFGVGHPHPRGYGTNSRVLGRYVRERGLLTLEDAVRKMTSLPALQFRLLDRGTLRAGHWADIVIFDENEVLDPATFEDPHHYAVGFRWVLVNGQPVIAEGEATGALPGRALRGPGTDVAQSQRSTRIDTEAEPSGGAAD
ncbi:MAG: D-aminoacylase [Candidatus Sumerlaeia bacterium]|nr:D-aminoacylase [Candidatus Sumerlaeia bacterium]